MTVKDLIEKLLAYPTDYRVVASGKDSVTFGVLEPDDSVIYLITVEGKKDLQ